MSYGSYPTFNPSQAPSAGQCSGWTKCQASSASSDCPGGAVCWQCNLGCYCGGPVAQSTSIGVCSTGGTGGYTTGIIYQTFLEGKQRKSRVVTKVNTQDAFSEFLQTFVGPLLASIGFLALLIYASKRVSEMEAIKKLMGMLDTVKKVAEGEVPTEIGEVPVPDISIDGSGGSGGGDGVKEKMAEMASDKLNEAAETAGDEAGNTLEKAIKLMIPSCD